MRRTASPQVVGRMTWSAGRRVFAALLCCGVLVSSAARAQILTDQVPLERLIPEQDKVKKDMERSRFRLGPVRILPSYYGRSAYDGNIFGTIDDQVAAWSILVSAGARFLVPLGSKMYLRINAFPAYTWYPEVSGRDNLGGLYDASLLGFFNHASVELNAFDTESYQFYSSELPGLALVRTQGGKGNLDLRISSRISLLASGFVQRIQYEQPEAPPAEQIAVRLNNRTDNAVRGGFRYHFSDQWNAGALVEETWSDFVLVPETRNNRSTGYLVTVGYNKPRFYLNLTGGYREGRAMDNSSFPAYSTPTGSFFVSYFLIRWLEIQAYGHRSIDYSVTSLVQPYYFENRAGGGLNIQVLPRVQVRGFAVEGPNNYPQVPGASGTITREEVLQYGGGLLVQFADKLVLSVGATRNVYNSDTPSNNRSYNTFLANLSFGGDFQR